MASGSHSDHATTSGGAAAEVSTSVSGGGRARSRSHRGGRGRGRQSAGAAPPSSPVLGRHSHGTVLEFVVELYGVLQGHLHLPRPFARVMEATKPPVLWLHAYGCSHDAMEVQAKYLKRRSMLLGRGWIAFTRA
ncbi:l-ascorbate oxidase-like protein [Hordeum vulgare]|nr:l-ascorbate oxidase-like protein [Hordeum vulgare]